MSKPIVAFVAAFTTVCLWASAFPLIHMALQSFAPIPLAAMRFSIASVIWLCWLIWKRPQIPSIPNMFRLFLCGAIGIATYNILLNTGQKTVSAGAASFIVNTVPVITVILAVAFLNEKYQIWAWIGTIVSFAGVAVIATGQPGGLSFGAGAMLVFGAAFCQAVFFTLQRPLIAIYGAKLCVAFVILMGTICLSPWLPQAIIEAKNAPLMNVMAVIYLGVFPAAIGYATWGIAQAYFGASRAANFLYLVPPVALTISFLLTGKVPDTTTLIGGAAAIIGVLIVNTRGRA